MLPFQRRTFRVFFLALALAALALSAPGCDSNDDDDGGGPAPQATIMSYNVYLGFDIFDLLGAGSLSEALSIGSDSYRTLLQTDFPARAGAIADQIKEAEPALVGLQEATLYRTQDGSDFLQNQEVNADSVLFDFLGLLQSELDARGLDYHVAAEARNTDVELPVDTDTTAAGTDLNDVRLTDRDVILARADVETSDAQTGLYDARQTYDVGGAVGVDLVRGYAKVRATVGETTLTFVDTHTDGGDPQEAQINQLAGLLDGYADPVVLTGDLNSPADGDGPPGYDILVENGPFADANAEANGADAEPTCCADEDLRGDAFDDKRIDFVLYRGAGVKAISGRVLGDELADKTASGLWPSDHAGVVATLAFDTLAFEE